MSACRVAIIADDLTGALDAAAPFAARGVVTQVVVSLERLETALASWQTLPDVIAVNTESRHLAANVAAERVVQVTRQLARLSPQQWFKKIDSTLRGHVVAECLALRRELSTRLLLAPAVPSQGRTVQSAEVRIWGEPLAQTASGRDARSTSLLGPLDTLFAARGLAMVRFSGEADAGLPAMDCVADAESDADLARLCDVVMRERRGWLVAGAAGMTTAMAQRQFGRLRPPRQRKSDMLGDVTAALVVAGSRSPVSLEQRQRLTTVRPALPVVQAPAGGAPVGETSLGQSPAPGTAVPLSQAALVVPGDSAHQDAEEVAGAMATQAATLWQARPAGKGLLFLTGGDIAMAVLTRLGVSHIAVDAEWVPGVAMGRLDGKPQSRVMTKAGGFGDPDLLVNLFNQLNPVVLSGRGRAPRSSA